MRLLFANPNNPTSRERKNLSIRLSQDEGKTWPFVRAIEPGPSGYCDLSVANDGTILCFYERGSTEKSAFRPAFLTVARFNLDWVMAGKKER
jgi:sialidase-1